jgi:chromosome segregation ATPase
VFFKVLIGVNWGYGMELLTMKEYAESRKVTYEAVCKQVRQYKKKELKGHLTYQGKLTFLDETAVDFLDRHRMKRNIVLAPTSEEVQRDMRHLQSELTRAWQEVDRLKTQIIDLQAEKVELVEDRAKYTALLELKEDLIIRINKADEEIKQLELDNKRVKAEIELSEKQLEEKQQEIEKNKQELDSYKPMFLGFYRKIKSQQPTDQEK